MLKYGMTEKFRKIPIPPELHPEKKYLSEEEITHFCQPCELLLSDNTCLNDHSYDWQANRAVREYCERAKVKGQRGKKEGGQFYPYDWMNKVTVEIELTKSEKATSMVNSVTAEGLIAAEKAVRQEFASWLINCAGHTPGPTAEEGDYDGYYANFFVILPGWGGGGYLTECYYKQGWLDIPHGEIIDERKRSPLYRTITRRLFTGLVYAAIEKEGLSLERIYALNQNPLDRCSGILIDYCMPVLVRLRAIGFTKNDLWH